MNNGVVLLKEVAENRFRLFYREDGKLVKHDFWYTPPVEGFVFRPDNFVDVRSEEVHFAVNMESHGSRYDKDSGVIGLVSVKRSDYQDDSANRLIYTTRAKNLTVMAAMAYWKMTSHVLGRKLVYRCNRHDTIFRDERELKAA